jgi:50S ribosomal subunit-associated GTPase HflX
VLNKCDLLAGSSLATAIEPLDDAIPCSAITGKGIPELLDAVSRLLVPEAPAERAAVVFHADQVTRLRQIIAAVESGELTEAAHALDWFFAITPWTLVE